MIGIKNLKHIKKLIINIMNRINHIGFGSMLTSLILMIIFLCFNMQESALVCIGAIIVGSFFYNYKRSEQEQRNNGNK
tara:strand:- start:485 stop:718 length:234 start_codon:yes stop_codon:yes gene_type:complete